MANDPRVPIEVDPALQEQAAEELRKAANTPGVVDIAETVGEIAGDVVAEGGIEAAAAVVEVGGEVVGGALEALGSGFEVAGGCAEGCGSLAAIVIVLAMAGSAMAYWVG